MYRMAVDRIVPPPPEAPQEEHDRYNEEARRRAAEAAIEAADRRRDALLRAVGPDIAERIRSLEAIVWKAAKADETTWREVREEALELLDRRAG